MKYYLYMKKKDKRLYPYCLIGLPLDEAKQKLKQDNPYIVLLGNGDATFLNSNLSIFIAETNTNNIIIDINKYE